MIKAIKYIVEDYFNNTDQMNNVLKTYDKQQKKYNKNFEERKQYLMQILGKITYNKYANNNIFAPIPLSALRFTQSDFIKLRNVKEFNPEKDEKFINEFKKLYPRNEFKFIDNGSVQVLQTNIIFKSLDDIVDFFKNIEKTYKKVYKDEFLNLTGIIKKFRNYLK